jgi:hypothetical protein
MADPLGMRCLYVGEDSTHLVLGSRAALVAAGLSPRGTRPSKDLPAATWLAHTTFWSGTQTGYVGVRTAPPGQYLELGPAGPRWVPGFLDSLVSGGVGEVPAATVAPRVVEDIAAGLAAVLRRPADRHVLQLTGGRDSRMLLAVALHAGIAHRFHYQTAGPPGLADVRIASALAGRYGLSHEALFVGMRSPAPYGVDQRRWVREVGGMMSAWEAPGRSMPDQRVTGVGGEFLRSFRKLRTGPAAEGAAAVVAGARFGRLGLVRPEITAAHHRVLEASVWPGDGDRSAHLEVHLFYALNRMRFTRLGPRLEAMAERRAYPLYSPALVAEALSVDPEERESDLICLEVLRLCAPELIELEFAGSSWDDRARREIGHGVQVDRPVAPPVQYQPPRSAPVEPVVPRSESLVQNLFAAQTDERADFVREVLADEDDQIWEVLHRPRTVDAAARWSTLDLIGRRELFGAISAAIWASGRPEPGDWSTELDGPSGQ